MKRYSLLSASIFLFSLLCLSILLAVKTWNNLQQLEQQIQQQIVDNKDRLVFIKNMHIAGRDRKIALLSILNNEDLFERDEIWMDFHHYGTQFSQNRLAFLSLSPTKEEEYILQKQAGVTIRIRPLADIARDLLLEDKLQQGRDLLTTKIIPGQQDIFALLSQLSRLIEQNNQANMINTQKPIQQQKYQLQWLGLSTLIFLFLATGSFFYMAMRSWSRVNKKVKPL